LESTATAALNTTATKTSTTSQNQNKIQRAGPAIQTGLYRYIYFKRKLNPQNTAVCNKSKINRVQIENKLPGRSNSNRFPLLSENEPEQAQETQPKPKPPPIYIREKMPNLVNKIVALTGDGNFHVFPATKGDIYETKLQTKSEEHFRAVSKYLEEARKSYYT